MLTLLALALAHSPNPTACAGTTTIDVNECLNDRLARSDAVLSRYYKLALSRIGRENGNKAAREFVKAERSWIAYRDSECTSAFDRYGGTIRVSVELDCRIRLTTLRTYAIWRDWLTYPDSTRALLPRPNVESVLSGR